MFRCWNKICILLLSTSQRTISVRLFKGIGELIGQNIINFLQKWLAHFLPIGSNEEIMRIKHFYSQENDDIFHIFDKIKVQEWRCESGIAIIA